MAAMVVALRGPVGRFRSRTRAWTRGTRGAANAAGGRVGSWAVHAEWVSVRVSTWGRSGGALLQCVRVGVPTQDRVSEDQRTWQEGTFF